MLANSRTRIRLMIVVGLFFPTLAPAATILFDQEPDAKDARNITQYRSADDINLASFSTVGAMRLWAVPFMGSFASSFSGTISWAIYQNSVGSLGSLVASGSSSAVTVTDSGIPFNFLDISQLDFAVVPFDLAAGQYWIEFHEGAALTTNDGSPIYWATAAAANFNAKQDTNPILPTSSIVPATGLAFQLFASSQSEVPEPGTARMMEFGIVGIFFYAMLLQRQCRRLTPDVIDQAS